MMTRRGGSELPDRAQHREPRDVEATRQRDMQARQATRNAHAAMAQPGRREQHQRTEETSCDAHAERRHLLECDLVGRPGQAPGEAQRHQHEPGAGVGLGLRRVGHARAFPGDLRKAWEGRGTASVPSLPAARAKVLGPETAGTHDLSSCCTAVIRVLANARFSWVKGTRRRPPRKLKSHLNFKGLAPTVGDGAEPAELPERSATWQAKTQWSPAWRAA